MNLSLCARILGSESWNKTSRPRPYSEARWSYVRMADTGGRARDRIYWRSKIPLASGNRWITFVSAHSNTGRQMQEHSESSTSGMPLTALGVL